MKKQNEETKKADDDRYDQVSSEVNEFLQKLEVKNK